MVDFLTIQDGWTVISVLVSHIKKIMCLYFIYIIESSEVWIFIVVVFDSGHWLGWILNKLVDEFIVSKQKCRTGSKCDWELCWETFSVWCLLGKSLVSSQESTENHRILTLGVSLEQSELSFSCLCRWGNSGPEYLSDLFMVTSN